MEKETPGTSQLLFVWGAEAFIKRNYLADHTWITTFDLRQNQFRNERAIYDADELYWFCFGKLRLEGRLLGAANGSRALSTCLVAPNARSKEYYPARGTIFHYRRDGYCHQVANQVLYSTGTKGTLLKVTNARLYWYTSALCGDYGRNTQDWETHKKRCDIRRGNPGITVDEFEARAREILGQAAPDLLRDLLKLRARAMADRPSNNASSASINKKNQFWFDAMADLLGPKWFKEIFGLPPEQRVILDYPDITEMKLSGRQTRERAVYRQTSKSVIVPGKAPTPPTVTLKHLAAALAETHEMSKKQAETMLGDLVGNVVMHLKKGERIRIGGLGILQVRKRAARIGRNPATGDQIKIKASRKVAFRASKDLKESI